MLPFYSFPLKVRTYSNVGLIIVIILARMLAISAEDEPNGYNNSETRSVTEHQNRTSENPSNDTESAEDRYKITSKDDREESILEIPIERPYTPVQDQNRTLYPVRIIVGESPCIYKKFMYFFNEAKDREINPFDLLMNATVTIHNQDYYFYDAEDLCISVDDELNIDIWQYDCSPGGVCVCGIYYGYVDIDIAPRLENRQIKYFQVNGLDRKIVTEDGECRSGWLGHCSLPESSASLKNPLKCSRLYECLLDDSYGPVFRNDKTGQMYGICLPRKSRVKGRSFLEDYEKSECSINQTRFHYYFLFPILTFLQTML